MAKWGEGDPRWIVEERADATNVNNWHWTEKNASGWSQEKLKSLFEGLKVANEEYCCEITELSKCEGEASASNRKAKLIFFYEWEIKCEWKGEVLSSGNVYKGNLEIPNLSDENEPKDIETNVTVTNEKDEGYKVKEFMRKEGLSIIQAQVAKYIAELKTEFSQGMILAKDASQKGSVNSAEKSSSPNVAKDKLSQPVVDNASKPLGVKIHCKRVTDKQKFQCSPGDLYRALTDKDMVKAYTRSEVKMNVEKGGQFILFGGNITGEFVELEYNKKIVMRWRTKSWPAEHFSTVTMDIDEKDDGTELKLTQTGVPDAEYERTRQGWNNFYWEAIKQTFGFGMRLF